MKIKRKFHIILPVLLTGILSHLQGQQYDPLYTQYMFNSQAINPAYAGTSGVLSTMLMSRSQWVGFSDAPNTQTFTINAPITPKSIGLGFSMIYDWIGPVINMNFSLDYSFRFRISENVNMSLGLKGSLNSFQKDLSKFWNEVGNDDTYYQEVDTRLLPNFGFGAYCYGNRFYVGASVPRLLENDIGDDGSVSSTHKENRLYVLMGGAIIGAGPSVKIKPSFLMRASNSAPLSYDLNINVLINEMLWVGALFRPSEAYGALLQVQITNQFRVGYAFEMSYNNMTSHHKGTHEIMLNYDFVFRKENVQNPRYF